VNLSVFRFCVWLHVYYISAAGRTTEAVASILLETTASV
jgi:hypothetical protein